jgi:type IV secretory pathway TrbF-like protein
MNDVQGIQARTVPTYERVAHEILRRDGNAEWREWRAYRIGAVVALALLAQTLVLAWAVLHVGRVYPVVQVVQQDEAGRLVKIGVPMDLLSYQPQEGAIRNMLTDWVNKKHSRDDAPSEVRARQDWRWLYLHTCGAARKHLEAAEKTEQPFNRTLTRTVKVEIDSVTKTVTPESYQVLWRATTVEKHQPRAQEVLWTSTFTVGRVSPKTVTDATLNNLGLCVTWFDDDKRH